MKFSLTVVFAGLVTFSGPTYGQNQLPPKHLRFMALGGNAVWNGKLNDKGIIEGQPPAPGETVPVSLFLKSGNAMELVRLRRTNPSEVMPLDPVQKGFFLLKKEDPAAAPWITSRALAAPFSLAVLYRDHKPPLTWLKPKMLLVPDDAASFPVHHLRLINISDRMIYYRVGGEKGQRYGVKAGATSVKPLKVGVSQVEIDFLVNQGKTEVSVYNNTMKIGNNERLQIVCSKGDGKGVVNAVNCIHFPESLPEAPAPPKKKPKKGK